MNLLEILTNIYQMIKFKNHSHKVFNLAPHRNPLLLFFPVKTDFHAFC
jgi:hypothetical protein